MYDFRISVEAANRLRIDAETVIEVRSQQLPIIRARDSRDRTLAPLGNVNVDHPVIASKVEKE